MPDREEGSDSTLPSNIEASEDVPADVPSGNDEWAWNDDFLDDEWQPMEDNEDWWTGDEWWEDSSTSGGDEEEWDPLAQMLDDLEAADHDDIVEALAPEVLGVDVDTTDELAAEVLDNINDAVSDIYADNEKVDEYLSEVLQSEQMQEFANEKIEEGIDEIKDGFADFFSGWGW